MPCAFMILLFATVAAAPTVPDQLDAILKDDYSPVREPTARPAACS